MKKINFIQGVLTTLWWISLFTVCGLVVMWVGKPSWYHPIHIGLCVAVGGFIYFTTEYVVSGVGKLFIMLFYFGAIAGTFVLTVMWLGTPVWFKPIYVLFAVVVLLVAGVWKSTIPKH